MLSGHMIALQGTQSHMLLPIREIRDRVSLVGGIIIYRSNKLGDSIYTKPHAQGHCHLIMNSFQISLSTQMLEEGVCSGGIGDKTLHQHGRGLTPRIQKYAVLQSPYHVEISGGSEERTESNQNPAYVHDMRDYVCEQCCGLSEEIC